MKILKYVIFVFVIFLSACQLAPVYRKEIESKLKVGMSQNEIINIIGQPLDVIEYENSSREDYVYGGAIRDNFYYTKLIFIDGKYTKWQPAGRNDTRAASSGNYFDSTTNQINQTNTNRQLNNINNTLNQRY